MNKVIRKGDTLREYGATVLKVKIMEQRGGTTHPILRSF
ncbi:Uncharacterised protein [Klebsiella pneumoniae]|uniref:Uncharacterized protein n=1 Tax=Klebsiella pneumoniae TaxID=573 RepID=A0A378BDK1_KLEPN|nr:Uncharacterised protein [Klebsiella pneumoniae]